MAARLELRMRKALAQGGQLYEAAELAQAAAQRHQRDGHPEAAVAVLCECATVQLQHPHVSGAVRRGVECAAAVLHLLNDTPTAPGAREAVRSLVVAVVKGAEEEAASLGLSEVTGGSHPLNTGSWGLHPDVSAAANWVQAACTWAAAHGRPDDVADLHDTVGSFLWRVARLKGLSDAVLHLCQGTGTPRFAAILAEAWAAGPQDRAWFILRTVALLIACGGLHRVPTLLAALEEHKAEAAVQDSTASQTEALVENFTRLYIRALQADSHNLASSLRARYEALLGDDPHMEDLLDQAEARVWPEQAAQRQQGQGAGAGGLASLLSALAG